MLTKLIFGRAVKKLVAYSQKKYEESGTIEYYAIILNGIGKYKIAVAPGDPHDYKLVIDAIHKFQAKHLGKNVHKAYEGAILLTAGAINAIKAIQMVLGYLDYEIVKVKNGTSRLSIDHELVLNAIEERCKQIADQLRAEEPDFDSWFKRRIDFARQEYLENRY